MLIRSEIHAYLALWIRKEGWKGGGVVSLWDVRMPVFKMYTAFPIWRKLSLSCSLVPASPALPAHLLQPTVRITSVAATATDVDGNGKS